MGVRSLHEDKPNLVCPECDSQFGKRDLRLFDKSDYDSFVDDFECPNCKVDLHPEDALFTYFRTIPTAEITGRPTQIGGVATVGTIELEVGKTKAIGLIGGGAVEIDLQLLAETNQPPGLTMQELQGVTFEWYPGPQVIDNAVVVDIAKTSNTQIHFITSELNRYAPTVTVAYNIILHRSEIPQPPWVTLLTNAINHYHHGEGLATYSLLFSAFENLLSRELSRTLRADGWGDDSIKEFLEDHWSWDNLCKKGLREATSKHLPTEYPDLYEDLSHLRNTRNNEIIHIDPGDAVADIAIPDLKNAFETIIESAIAINKICFDKRQSI